MDLRGYRGGPARASHHSIEGSVPEDSVGQGPRNFELGDALLLVATDRLSAFDVILLDGIPGKGILLTQMSLWWFARTSGIIANHLLADRRPNSTAGASPIGIFGFAAWLSTGCGPYRSNASSGAILPAADGPPTPSRGPSAALRFPRACGRPNALPEPIFTPTTKAAQGSHDEPIDDARASATVGSTLYSKVKAASLALYRFGHDRAREAGMILADTKFEFGTDSGGGLVLIDEVLTPDSSRYWPSDSYEPGRSPPSYDKQFCSGSPAEPFLGPKTARPAPAPRGGQQDPRKISGRAPGPDGPPRAYCMTPRRSPALRRRFGRGPARDGASRAKRSPRVVSPWCAGRIAELAGPDAVRRVERDKNRADRVLVRAAAGSRKSGDRQGIIRTQLLGGAGGHRDGCLRADAPC